MEFELVAASWVDHLRRGGVTPWAEWAANPPPPTVSRLDGPLPGAAQLEVVRRLSLEQANDRRVSTPTFRALADRVLARSGPGRGPDDIPLPWPGGGATAPGSAVSPADPGQLPADELTRICVGVLADLVHERELPPPDRRRRRRWRTPWGRHHVVHGPPLSADALRASLEAAGRVEGGSHPHVILLAGTVDEMLREVWTARVQRGGEARWARFVANCVTRDRLPMSADLSTIARYWAQRVEAARVHVVVGAGTGSEAVVRARVGEILGIPEPPAVAPAALTPASVDVLRRLNGVLRIQVGESRAQELTSRLVVPHLLEHGVGGRLVVPGTYTRWAHQWSMRMTEELAVSGYNVHGELARIISRPGQHDQESPGAQRALRVALQACLRAAGSASGGMRAG